MSDLINGSLFESGWSSEPIFAPFSDCVAPIIANFD